MSTTAEKKIAAMEARETKRRQAGERERKARKVREWAKQGVQKQLRRHAMGELFEVKGIDRERETGAGMQTLVPSILDPRLNLDPRQRAVGTHYGLCVEGMGAGGPEWMREYVDKSSSGGGGHSEAAAMKIAMVKAANEALDSLPVAVFSPRRPAKGRIGCHAPVKMRWLMEAICVAGFSLTYVGVMSHWTRERNGKDIVPDRQRKHLAASLCLALDEVGDVWDRRQMRVPFDLFALDID